MIQAAEDTGTVQYESTCGADALVLHGLMRECTCMHSHHLGVVIT